MPSFPNRSPRADPAPKRSGHRWLLILLAVAISAWVIHWAKRDGFGRWGLISAGLLVGGAAGNVIDRIQIGAVVDFLDFSGLGFPWIFNIADSAISVGVGLLILDSFLSERRTEPVGSEAQTE